MNLYESFLSYLKSASDIHITDTQDNSILFTKGSLNFGFRYEPKDPMYFCLTLPIVEDITEDNRSEVLTYSQELTRQYKIGKALDIDDSIWLIADSFIDPEPSCNHIVIYERIIRLLNDMFNDYISGRRNDEREESKE